MRQTKNIDKCECIECGNKFDGAKACNYDMSAITVKCPVCETVMFVDISIEYLCTEVTE